MLHRNVSANTRHALRSCSGEAVTIRTTPEDGDIVIRQEEQNGADVYLLHTAPGADHHLFRTLEEAVAQAVTLAKLNQVRAWLTTDEGYDFVLVEDFRVTDSVWNKR
jgi:hypothetical protein